METVPLAPAGTVTLGDLAIPYYDSGVDAPGTDPIVLIHGSAGSTMEHYGFIYPLLGARRRVVSIDLCVPVDRELTVDALQQQVEAVIDEVLPGRSVTVVGYSLGAVVSAAVAAARPEVVRQLVLIAGWMRTDNEQVLVNAVLWELLRLQSPQLAVHLFTHFLSGEFLTAQPMELLEAMMQMGRFDETVVRQFELNGRVDISDRMDAITAQTLVIGCTHDRLAPVRHSKQLFGAIENARYAEVDCGHAIFIERPAEALRLIEHFTAQPDRHPVGSVIPAHRP